MTKGIWQTRYEDLLKKIPKEVQRCNDDYGLDLCEDGLEDFYRSLGVEYTKKADGSLFLNFYVEGLPVDETGYNFAPKELEDIRAKVESEGTKWLSELLGVKVTGVEVDYDF